MTLSHIIKQKILSRIKQREPGAILGGLRTIFTRTQTYFSIINFMLILITAYYTTIRHIIPWLPFYIFFIGLIILLCCIMIFEYTIMFPSDITFQWHQVWRPERNPMVKEVRQIHNQLHDIQLRLSKIEDMLNRR